MAATLDEIIAARIAEGWAVKVLDGHRAVLERRMTSGERVAARDVRVFGRRQMQLVVTVDATGAVTETQAPA